MAALPSAYQCDAAAAVARLIDEQGSTARRLDTSFRRHASAGVFTVGDLNDGLNVLLAAGLAIAGTAGVSLTPDGLELGLASGDDATAILISAYLQSLSPAAAVDVITQLETGGNDPLDGDNRIDGLFNDAFRRLLGASGEEVVANSAREQLQYVGRPDLADQVRRVSLISDSYGFDVEAPSPGGQLRLFEVKSITSEHTPDIEFYLSRNEFEVGRRNSNWHLVICCVHDVNKARGTVVGWLNPADLEPHVAADRGQGLWQSILFRVDRAALAPGLPT